MERPFDRQIKEALEGYQVPYDEQSWDRLEMRLQQENLVADATSVDEIAKEVMSKFEVPYSPSTWHILTEKLEQLDYNRKLITVKFIEAALILFAFLTIIRFTSSTDTAPTHSGGMAFDITTIQERLENTGQADLSITSENEQAAPVTEDHAFDIAGSDRNALNTRSQARVVTPLVSVIRELVLPSEQIALTEVPYISHNDRYPKPVSSPEAPFDGLDPLLNELSLLEDPHGLVSGQADYMTYTLPVLSWPGERKLQTKVGFYSQGNMHRVFTPELYSPYRVIETVALSSGVGFVTAVHIGNAGFDFGFVYERLSFQGSLDNNLIQKAAIPVHLKFIPLSVESINMYVKGGGSLHGVLNALYEEPFLRTGTSSNQFQDKESFNDGLLNDGLTDNNVYVTANVGIGLEKAIYKNIYFFGEALYQRQVLGEGIGGTTRNTFRTISLNLGINYTIR